MRDIGIIFAVSLKKNCWGHSGADGHCAVLHINYKLMQSELLKKYTFDTTQTIKYSHY